LAFWAWPSLALATVAVAGVFFGEVILGKGVYYSGDIARLYLPQRVALAQALAGGSLPWWTTSVGAGYPLLAEGEVGALYPPNWVLYRLLPADAALNVSIVLHYLIAGAGCYCFSRLLGSSRGAAYFGSLVLALGGFYVAHLGHVSIVTVASWLPWMFTLTHLVLTPRDGSRRRRSWSWVGLAAVVGLQFLGGHTQMSLLGLIPVAAYALYLTGVAGLARDSLGRFALWIGALALGALIGMPQLWPTFELAGVSQRAGGLDSQFFTSYSFHPGLLATFLSPFLLGNPYPQGSVELMGYVGLLPLGLAIVAAWRARSTMRWFLGALGLAGVLLAFGRWNPVYEYLRRVPLLNLFRVPARYLCWTSFALAVLSAAGYDALPKWRVGGRRWMGWAILGSCALALCAALIGVWRSPGTDTLVATWRWLPGALLVAALAVLLSRGRLPEGVWGVAAFLVLLVDLYAYGTVLDKTYNSVVPRDEVRRMPRSLRFLEGEEDLYRIYTKEEILPAMPVMRESFFPNIALGSGLASANVYQPLVPKEYGRYLDGLTAERLNRLNVRYYLIPQLLPVDETSELYDVQNPFASLPANTWLEFPPIELAGLEVESYLSHSVAHKDGELAAELVLRDAAGSEIALPLRVGIESAEWAYERTDVQADIAHHRPPVASTFPARSGLPPEEHAGHTYLARLDLPESRRTVAIMLRPVMPGAFVRVERVRLRDVAGREELLSHLAGLGDHSLVYRSEDVVIYRNKDALPRAYTLPASLAKEESGELTLAGTLPAHDVGRVDVLHYGPTWVELRAVMGSSGYLVLADLAYPGWRASVDSAPVPILRADGVFRAVSLAPGEHHISFRYKPWWARLRPALPTP
jgi:hypothetical protein